MSRHVGVALSGGGHRATMWGLGALLYLADSGRNAEVSALSSVSGGSILNGVVAHEVDYGDADAASVDAAVTPLVRHVADTGLFFWGPATNPYVVSLLALVAAGAGALGTGLVLVARDGLRRGNGLLLLGALVVLALAARWFERRGIVVDRALARTHFSRDGRATRLADVVRSVDHVFCATELQAGQHVYFAPGFVYSYRFGVGQPGDLRLSTVVQASACLPGAFPVRRLPARPCFADPGRATEMALMDGGVYDNMADEWPVGLRARLRRVPELPVTGRVVDELLVVNASAPTPWRAFARSRLVLLAELATLQRVSSVMYQVTTQRRRAALFDAWRTAERLGEGMRGTFVHVAQTPYVVADAALTTADRDRQRRAAAVVALLGDDPASRARWQSRVDRNRAVRTVLRKLGRETTLDLLEHAYVLAMCNAHVSLGYPLLPLPDRDRFARLLDPAPA